MQYWRVAHEDLVRFPVSCPLCRNEVLAEYRRADVVGALLNERPIRLYAPCCEKSWTAGYIEMQQIRAYFDADRPDRLDSPSRTPPPKSRETLDD
jgi:hypothetical protein